MAFQNKVIYNPFTRQQLRFVRTGKETRGRMLEIEASFEPHSKEPAPHYHPYQEETFTVLTGELSVRMHGETRVLKKGQTLYIPRNMVHSMWNNADVPTTVSWKVRPALNTEHFLETAMGLANDNKTDSKGMPRLLQVALMANRFSRVFRLSRPPFVVQKLFFITLTPFAYMLGYRPTYDKYLD